MRARVILAILRKDLIDTIANKMTLFGLLAPIFMVILFAVFSGLLSNADKPTHILVYNPSQSALEQVISKTYEKTKVTKVDTAEAVQTAFGPNGSKKESEYALGLIIPEDFDALLRKGAHPDLGLYINGSEIPQGAAAKTTLMSVVNSYASSLSNPVPVRFSVVTINPPDAHQLSLTQQMNGFYGGIALLMSFLTGMTIVPNLLVEEKEKKTLRMLMVSPASFADILIAKLLFALIYQLIMTVVVLIAMKGLSGNIPMLGVFVVLGACFSLSMGLLAGCIFQTATSLGGFTGVMTMLFLFPAMLASDFMSVLLQGSPLTYVARAVPTYYLADGFSRAVQNAGWNGTVLLDMAVIAACAVVLLVLATLILKRQAKSAAQF
ncbi:ABC-2 type transport system permease protein [Thermosporothrix hazakensis]|jgi:ABC-2 type transport system permease protein|uniref:ABC-2 type transport system permease protein n=1 Tax=Thermosporothrix hazakensis TaxID=644383 RepID=A0A326U174_THEHA|nr:ABC transporter permease [Thermosporothrix hazakensis]PZW23908.1 ABC-2 type transport system permease protein [Thermosporothrix hazakensis]GCE48494.1 ABC transporter permease [Thermosporothrix hazakensis]